MKVNEYYIDAINADKVLDILKTSIEPKDNPRLNLTKIRSPYNVAYKIGYTAYVSKEDYKRIKAIATNETSADDETNSPKLYVLPENVQDFLEHYRELLLAIANHEDCEKRAGRSRKARRSKPQSSNTYKTNYATTLSNAAP